MKLLIVDDEVIIRTGLSTVIPWAENGFSLLPAAASAEEALMRIPVERPELILTDIRMTGASGLEMSSEVLASYPDTEVIVLSGYDEFTYAQQAIRQGVSEYLLKTSGPDEILQAALRARDRRLGKLEREESRRMQSEAYYGQQISRLLGGGGRSRSCWSRRSTGIPPCALSAAAAACSCGCSAMPVLPLRARSPKRPSSGWPAFSASLPPRMNGAGCSRPLPAMDGSSFRR